MLFTKQFLIEDGRLCGLIKIQICILLLPLFPSPFTIAPGAGEIAWSGGITFWKSGITSRTFA